MWVCTKWLVLSNCFALTFSLFRPMSRRSDHWDDIRGVRFRRISNHVHPIVGRGFGLNKIGVWIRHAYLMESIGISWAPVENHSTWCYLCNSCRWVVFLTQSQVSFHPWPIHLVTFWTLSRKSRYMRSVFDQMCKLWGNLLFGCYSWSGTYSIFNWCVAKLRI
jgi:hypothetical protein